MDKTVIVQSHLLDVNTRHPPDYLYRHSGTPEGVLVMCFRTPAWVSTDAGVETVGPGDCLIHDQAYPHRHGSIPGAREGFRNDWLMVRTTVALPLLETYGLPMDRVLPTGRVDVLEPALLAIRNEIANRDEFSDGAIRSWLAQLFLSIHRACRDEETRRIRMSSAEREYYDRFKELRDRIREDYRDDTSVAGLAERLNLGPERFSALYRKFFGTSPYADRLNARLLAARRLLATTSMTARAIALDCGFKDAYYFSRLFKKRNGRSPTQFRRNS